MREELREYLERELASNQLESAWVQVSKNGEVVLKEAVGVPSADGAIDAGSLVEVVAILPAILKSVERRKKKLALNHLVSQYLPAYKEKGKESIQIMNLLTHTSGLPDSIDLDLQEIAEAELTFQPGSKVAYSSLNMQLLPLIYEMASGFSFEDFLENFIFNPLLMTNTEVRQDEKDWHKMTSTLSDLGYFATMIEQNGTYDYLKIINKKAMLLSKQNFTSFLNENRGLGWALQSETTSISRFFSEESYGFIGPDGVSMWFDPKLKSHIILILEGANNQDQLSRIQSEVHQLIYPSLQ